MEPTVDLEACLPAALRERSPTITKIAVGMSGAGVYRVDAGGDAYVLRLSGPMIDPAAWRRQLAIERLAADAGLAPRVVHVDEARRAVVSAFVVDRSFPALLRDPATHGAAIDLLARTFRRLHALPLPEGATARDPRELLGVWPELYASYALPAFADDLVRRVLDAPAAIDDRAPVLGHNDPNPTNMVYDGTDLLLLDWDSAGPMHPYYDLAVISMFLRMGDDACRRLLSTYAGEPVAEQPESVRHFRRLGAVTCGAMSVRLACLAGHRGDAAATLEATPSLADCYQRLRMGAFNLATGADQWQFGLALIKESAGL
jgi:aminoglycoside phosphotransferase (APT) family kinase protein